MMVSCASPERLPDRLFPQDLGEDCEPQHFAGRILSQAKSSFAFGLRTLPRERRHAMIAVYAFARTVDDIADSRAPEAQKLEALDAWRIEIDRVFAGDARSTVGRALQPAVARFALPQEEFALMLEGMTMDVRAPIVAPALEELARYTRRVAGTIGQLSVRCFGAAAGSHRDIFALALADAMQLTNILRDVAEDAAAGRIYLPREILDAHGVPADCAAIAHHPRLPDVSRALGAIAQEEFAAARRALVHLDRRLLRPALIFMGVYETYLHRIARAGWCGATMRPMARWEKIMCGLRYAFWLPEQRLTLPGRATLRLPERSTTLEIT